MKINICDVCLADEGRITESKISSGFSGREMKISVCERHKEYLREKGYGSLNMHDPEAVKKYLQFLLALSGRANSKLYEIRHPVSEKAKV